MNSLVLAALVAHNSLSIQTPTPSVASKLDELLTAYHNLGRFNGSALVAYHGSILLQKGYGFQNVDQMKPNAVDTRFQIASVTKTFTSTLVLKLVSEHKLALTDHLSKFFPGIPNGDAITIRELLNHTSGLHDFTSEPPIDKTTEKKMVTFLKTLKPDFKPGTSWKYSNSGYVMLGYIVSKVTGLTYFDAVRKYLFQPTDMRESGFDFSSVSKKYRAIGYDDLTSKHPNPSKITDPSVPLSAGAIYSTVADMYRWHRALQKGTVLSKAMLQQAYTPSALHNYGYGWQIDSVYGKTMVSHSGAISGFGSNFARVPSDDLCIVLLSNVSGSTVTLFHITDRLLAVIYDKPYSIPVKRTEIKLPTASLAKFCGQYQLEGATNGVFDIRVDHDHLRVFVQGGPTDLLLAYSDTAFYLQSDDEAEIRFVIGKGGSVESASVHQAGITVAAKKIGP